MTLSGITHRLISIDFLTPEYRIVGKVVVGSSGLFGLLADSNRSVVNIKQAQIAFMNQPTLLVRKFDDMFVTKERIFAACVERREDIGLSAVAHRGYTDYLRYPLHLMACGYEVELLLEWTGHFDLATLLADNTRNFVPGYHAAISSVLYPRFSIQTPAVLINIRMTDMITMAQPPGKEEEEPAVAEEHLA